MQSWYFSEQSYYPAWTHTEVAPKISSPSSLVDPEIAHRLLQENPDPTEEEVRFGISGNLCRCTGYQNIVKSILAAAATINGAKEAAE